MGLPQKRDAKVFEEAIAVIQAAKGPRLKLFSDIREGARTRREWCFEELNLHYIPDQLRLMQLHRDPNVEIISEKEHVTKLSIVTYVRYWRRVTEKVEEDPKISELWPK